MPTYSETEPSDYGLTKTATITSLPITSDSTSDPIMLIDGLQFHTKKVNQNGYGPIMDMIELTIKPLLT